MKTLDDAQSKIKKICDTLRKDTLEPAIEEANQIIEAAKKKAESIVADAEKQAERLITQSRSQIEQERHIFHSSLQQAAKQAMEALRQDIEHNLFDNQLEEILKKQASEPNLIAQIINAIVHALEKEGISTDLSVVIPKTVSAEAVNALLLSEVQKKLKDKPLAIGAFAGGAQVKLIGKRMSIDLTDLALKELLSTYARKDFQKLFFS